MNRRLTWKAGFLFYQSFAPLALLLNIIFCCLLAKNGITALMPLMLFKGISYGIIYLSISAYSANKLVFFYNMHISRRRLWLMALCFDIIPCLSAGYVIIFLS